MEWAAIEWEKLANAIVILVGGLAAFFGLRSGRSAPVAKPEASPHVEIAGALVDSSSVKLLAGEVAGQALAITAQTAAIRDATEEAKEGRHATNRLREAVDRLSMELARRS